MKKIMILGASILQLPAILQAKKMGLEAVVVDMNPEAVGFRENGIEKEIISTNDIDCVLEAAIRHQINGIMTLASDLPMRTVAAVAEKMGLVGISGDTALKATNKAAMRQALKEAMVPIPVFYCVNTIDEFHKIIRSFTGKFIVKPADNSGSRGVCLLEHNDDLAAANQAFLYCKHFCHTGEMIVEEYMEGPEVSVETISVDGVCHVIQITDKLTTGAPYFVEMGHSQPCCLSEKTKREIAKAAVEANKAVGIKNGPSHTEIKITPDGAKIVEIGARLGGDNITTHLVPLSTGVNMVECCIRIAIGENPDLSIKYDKGAAIRYFDSPKGVIHNIIGIPDAEKIDGIQQISIVHGVGYTAHEVHNSVDRVGFVIAQSDNAESAVKACKKAVDMVKFQIDENG